MKKWVKFHGKCIFSIFFILFLIIIMTTIIDCKQDSGFRKKIEDVDNTYLEQTKWIWSRLEELEKRQEKEPNIDLEYFILTHRHDGMYAQPILNDIQRRFVEAYER